MMLKSRRQVCNLFQEPVKQPLVGFRITENRDISVYDEHPRADRNSQQLSPPRAGLNIQPMNLSRKS